MFLTPQNLIAEVLIFGQSLEWPDLVIVGLLVILEGLLSIDNALVLGLLAKRLPKEMRARALSYGLIGAVVFRILAIAMASFLLQWTLVKLIGGGYLIFIALKHLLFQHSDGPENKVVLDADGQPQFIDAATGGQIGEAQENIEIEQRVPVGASMITSDSSGSAGCSGSKGTCNVFRGSQAAFWRTVLVIELTDIAFAVDSILAAMALAGSERSKLWVVIVGGILGVILMRFAAAIFIKLLDRFPRFEISAYLLVIVIGMKLVVDWGCNSDWSFNQSPWISKNLGSWKQSFSEFEDRRRLVTTNYEGWLKRSWPLGIAEHHSKPVEEESPSTDRIAMPKRVPHMMDFHDVRRPESITFWSLMAICFGIGFLPTKRSTMQTAN